MRLVGHHQQLVLEQHLLFARNFGFGLQVAPVVEALLGPVGRVGRHGPAGIAEHVAGGHALGPGLAGQGGQALGQEVQHRGPGPGRQGHAARAQAVAGWNMRTARGVGHLDFMNEIELLALRGGRRQL